MDQRERYIDEPETYRIAFEALQKKLWTSLPCVVQAFPAASGLGKMILDAQPLIAASYLDVTGNTQVLQLPLLVDLPICWPGGGGVTLTFPIKPGDECLVTFTARCLDAWWQLGAGSAPNQGRLPPDPRLHSLSDGVAHVGIRSNPRAYAPSSVYAQLITDDLAAGFSVDPTTHNMMVSTTNGVVTVHSDSGNINVTTNSGNINANGVTIDPNGNMTVPGNLTCSQTITGQTQVVAGTGSNAVHLTTHKHPTAATGSPSPPTPGT